MSYQTIKIENVERSCKLCDQYAEKHLANKPKVAVLSCEGACSRGEVSRRAANLIAHQLAPEQTVRICLGGAFIKDSGQRELVRKVDLALAVEGCHTDCASRMMKGVIPELSPQVVRATDLYTNSLPFGIEEVSEELFDELADTVARQVAAQYLPATGKEGEG